MHFGFLFLLCIFLASGLGLAAQENDPSQMGSDAEGGVVSSGEANNDASEASDPTREPSADSSDAAADSDAPSAESSAADERRSEAGEVVDVYVIPITGAISQPNLYILRRGLKEAITNEVDMVLLDMDTPGGRVDYTLEMMEMLAKFEGITATYINVDAISAGSFIAAATQEIYFAPQGKIGASAVIQGGGQDVPETARMKIESYLRANIRVITQDYPHRSEVVRAMLDADYALKIGDEIIKPAGELLTLTAREAMQTYGDPPAPLLGAGIHSSTEALLDERFGPGNYEIRDFDLTYSEVIAKWMNTFAPALLGIGLLALFLEFKTPGFGFFGVGGIVLLGIFFIAQYIAGLAGNEPVLFFALGIILVLVELFFFPGMVIFALSGLGLILGALIWAMVDIWPGEPISVSPGLLAEPIVNLVLGLSIAAVGAIIASRMFPTSWMGRRLVLAESAGGDSQALRTERAAMLPAAGSRGTAVTDLFPSGRVEIEGNRYDARAALGPIEHGRPIRVKRAADFGLLVEEDSE